MAHGLQEAGASSKGAARAYASPFPFKVTWDITHRCNLRCRHCFVIFQGDVQIARWDRQKDLQIAESIKGSQPFLVSIAGGEPFLVPHLETVVQALLGDGTSVIIATSGTVYGPERLAALKNLRGLSFQVSIDGASSATHDAVRGPGNFDKVVRFVRDCDEIPVTLAVTLTEAACRELAEIIELALRLRVRALKLQKFVAAPSVPDKSLGPSDEALAIARHSLVNAAEALSGKNLVLLHPFDVIRETDAVRSVRVPGGVGVGLKECTITPTGDVVLCGAMLGACNSGRNVLHTPLKYLWKEFTEERARLGENAGYCLCDT